MTRAWLQVSTGRVEPLPVLLPAVWPFAIADVLDFLAVVDVNALRTYESLTVRQAEQWPDMERWTIAQILLHRTGIDARPFRCDWGLGVSLTRETLVLFGRGPRMVEGIPMQEGLRPMGEWYLAHLPTEDVIRDEIDELMAPGGPQRG